MEKKFEKGQTVYRIGGSLHTPLTVVKVVKMSWDDDVLVEVMADNGETAWLNQDELTGDIS